MFVKRGFDHVTVAEVAAAAGVSEKTVFNYFPTKEDLFFDEVDEREAALVEAVSNREPGESVPAALERVQAAGCGRLCSEGFAPSRRIIDESPALQAKELELMARFTDALAGTIRDELGVRGARRSDRGQRADRRPLAALPHREGERSGRAPRARCGEEAALRPEARAPPPGGRPGSARGEWRYATASVRPRRSSSIDFGMAPTAAAAGSPSLNRISVGIDITP